MRGPFHGLALCALSHPGPAAARRARGARGPVARPTRAHGLELLGHLAANGERDALREVGGERARGPGLALEARRDLVEVVLRELAEERDAFRVPLTGVGPCENSHTWCEHDLCPTEPLYVWSVRVI